MRQDHAGGERIRDQQRMLDRQRFEDDNSQWRELFVFVRRDLDLNGFLFAGIDWTDDTAIQPPYDFVLLQRRHVDKDGNAVTEQCNNAVGSGTERQRQRRQDIAAFQARGLDTVAKHKRPYGNALLTRYRQIDHENLVFRMT